MHLLVFILTNSLSSSILLAETVIVLSSAKFHKNKEDIVFKNIEESGPRIDPCGTP